MIYSLFPNDMIFLPPPVRQEIVAWITEQGIDPNRCAGLAYNHDRKETWFKLYKHDPHGRKVVLLDDDMKVVYEEMFIPLQGKPPRQLEYFIPSESPPAHLGPPSDIVMWDA